MAQIKTGGGQKNFSSSKFTESQVWETKTKSPEHNRGENDSLAFVCVIASQGSRRGDTMSGNCTEFTNRERIGEDRRE